MELGGNEMMGKKRPQQMYEGKPGVLFDAWSRAVRYAEEVPLVGSDHADAAWARADALWDEYQDAMLGASPPKYVGKRLVAIGDETGVTEYDARLLINDIDATHEAAAGRYGY